MDEIVIEPEETPVYSKSSGLRNETSKLLSKEEKEVFHKNNSIIVPNAAKKSNIELLMENRLRLLTIIKDLKKAKADRKAIVDKLPALKAYLNASRAKLSSNLTAFNSKWLALDKKRRERTRPKVNLLIKKRRAQHHNWTVKIMNNYLAKKKSAD